MVLWTFSQIRGATDLFVQRVPYFIIKKMGRWKSEAAMIYYHCDDDVRQAVAVAFDNLAKEVGGVYAVSSEGMGGGMDTKPSSWCCGQSCEIAPSPARSQSPSLTPILLINIS